MAHQWQGVQDYWEVIPFTKPPPPLPRSCRKCQNFFFYFSKTLKNRFEHMKATIGALKVSRRANNKRDFYDISFFVLVSCRKVKVFVLHCVCGQFFFCFCKNWVTKTYVSMQHVLPAWIFRNTYVLTLW